MKYILPLVLISLFFSCSGPSEIAHEPISVDTLNTIDGNIVDKAKYVNNISVNEFLNLPFTLSVMSDEKWTTDQKLHPNQHNKKIIDTLSTMSFKRSIIHVHNHDLIDGHIVDNEIKLVKNIHVGMKKSDFLSSFNDIKNNADAPFVSIKSDYIKIGCCAEQNDVWTFTFDSDTIASIDYSSYLD